MLTILNESPHFWKRRPYGGRFLASARGRAITGEGGQERRVSMRLHRSAVPGAGAAVAGSAAHPPNSSSTLDLSVPRNNPNASATTPVDKYVYPPSHPLLVLLFFLAGLCFPCLIIEPRFGLWLEILHISRVLRVWRPRMKVAVCNQYRWPDRRRDSFALIFKIWKRELDFFQHPGEWWLFLTPKVNRFILQRLLTKVMGLPKAETCMQLVSVAKHNSFLTFLVFFYTILNL